MDEFKEGVNKYNYVYQKMIPANETRICVLPKPKAGQKAVKKICWYAAEAITVYATICDPVDSNRAVWEEIMINSEISPCITAIKFVNETLSMKPAIVRVIME